MPARDKKMATAPDLRSIMRGVNARATGASVLLDEGERYVVTKTRCIGHRGRCPHDVIGWTATRNTKSSK